MQLAILDQQIIQKITLLDPIQKQTVYAFVDFLLSKPIQHLDEKEAALLSVSVWDEQDIKGIEEVQKQLNSWQLPIY